MDAWLGALKDTPLPTIFVVAGIAFWVLALAGSIAGQIKVRPGRQWAAGIVGTVFIVLGIGLYVTPIPPRDRPAANPPDNRPDQPFVDSVRIQSIGPRPNAPLHQRTDIQLVLDYSLFSADRAILAIYLEEFSQTAGGCNGTEHHTNGGKELRVARGEHVVPVTVSWPGAPGSGFLTVGANFWRDVDGKPVGPPTELGLFTEFCYSFSR